MHILKVEVPGMGFEPFSHQGESLGFEFSSGVGCSAGVEFMTRLCPSVSSLLQCGFLLICPMRSIYSANFFF